MSGPRVGYARVSTAGQDLTAQREELIALGVDRLLFSILGMVAEFEADLIRARTREAMKIAKAAGTLRGKQPTLSKTKRKHLPAPAAAGTHTHAERAELFDVSRTTIYRELRRDQPDE